MITADRVLSIDMNVYTPDSVGIFVRRPPMLPYAAALRGTRIAGTRAYAIRSLAFPSSNDDKRRRRQSMNRR